MRSLESIARDLLNCAISWEKDARVIGNVTAEELAFVVQRHLLTCPKCGTEPWCNIDCDLCVAMGTLEKQEPSTICKPHLFVGTPPACTRCGELDGVGMVLAETQNDAIAASRAYTEVCRALGLVDDENGRGATVEEAVREIKRLQRDAQAFTEVEEELADLKDVINQSLPRYCNSDDGDDECNEAEKVEAAGDDLLRNNVSGWKRKDMDTAYALPFGTIRKCNDCGCLVAGGPTTCRRCVKATGMR